MSNPVEIRETSHERINAYYLSREEQRYVQVVSPSLPQLTLEKDALAQSVLEEFRNAFLHPTLETLHTAMKESLTTSHASEGYILIRGLPIDMVRHRNQGERIITALASLVGLPIKVYQRWPLHKPLGVNSYIDPMRATGTGVNPLHIDMVNTTAPPHFVCFAGVRADPAGGGASIASRFPQAIEQLQDEEIELLKQHVFYEGKFFDLTRVGEEYRPFPVLQMTPLGVWHPRYSGKGIEIKPESEKTQKSLERFGALLESTTVRFLLAPNEVAIFNQRIAAHGREALGDRYMDYPAEEQRLITQLFLATDQNSIL